MLPVTIIKKIYKCQARAVIDWPLCINTSTMSVSTIKRRIERNKEDK